VGITKIIEYIINRLLTNKRGKLFELEEGKVNKFIVTMARIQPEKQIITD
jgi:hypothetical protein